MGLGSAVLGCCSVRGMALEKSSSPSMSLPSPSFLFLSPVEGTLRSPLKRSVPKPGVTKSSIFASESPMSDMI